MDELTEAMVKTIQAAAKKRTGANRRSFEAQASFGLLGWRSKVGGNCVRLVSTDR